MKQGHLFCIFVLIAVGCFLSLYCMQKKYDSLMQEKQKLEDALLAVLEDTGSRSKIAVGQEEKRKKETIETAFSEAFRVFMGGFDTSETLEFWRMYVPMLVWVEEDGAYFYYLQSYIENEEMELNHTWTEKEYFSFPDGCSDKKKKSIMADILEKKASDIITNHNAIAVQYGISYRYSLPTFFQDTSRLTEFPMLFVVFQGWPLNDAGKYYYYNACVDAGIFLRQKDKTVVQYPKVLTEDLKSEKY